MISHPRLVKDHTLYVEMQSKLTIALCIEVVISRTTELPLRIVDSIQDIIPDGHGVIHQKLLIAERYQHGQLVAVTMIEVAAHMYGLGFLGAATQRHFSRP